MQQIGYKTRMKVAGIFFFVKKEFNFDSNIRSMFDYQNLSMMNFQANVPCHSKCDMLKTLSDQWLNRWVRKMKAAQLMYFHFFL